MAAVLVQIRGTLYDLTKRTSQQVLLQGEASLMGLGIGGGPIVPPEGGGGELPDHIWGPTDPRPTPPIALPPGYPGSPPGIWGPTDPRPTPPIYIPPNVPPVLTPPDPPTPGAPTTPVPPPEGSGGWPVQPITPPPYIVVMYPGIGPVTVAPPAQAEK